MLLIATELTKGCSAVRGRNIHIFSGLSLFIGQWAFGGWSVWPLKFVIKSLKLGQPVDGGYGLSC
jgi:hypothetical protein